MVGSEVEMVRRTWVLGMVALAWFPACGGLGGSGGGARGDRADVDGDGFTRDVDCDDADAAVFPGADEICDGIDNDCNGTADDDYAFGARVFFVDRDGDGFGSTAADTPSCSLPPGHARLAGDCDDSRADIHPDADERCDDLDRDCDRYAHAGAVDARPHFVDADGDGFAGTEAGPVCALEHGTSWTQDDCDDRDAQTWPGAPEQCDDRDNDCDGDEGFDVLLGRDADSLAQAFALAGHEDQICVPRGAWPAVDLDPQGRALTLLGDHRGGTVLTGEGRRFAVGSGSVLWVRDLSLGELALSAEHPHGIDVIDGTLRLQSVQIGSAQRAQGTARVPTRLIRVQDAVLDLHDVQVRRVSLDQVPASGGAVLSAVDSTVRVQGLDVQDVSVAEPLTGMLQVAGGRLQARDVVWRDVWAPAKGSVGALLHASGAEVTLDRIDVKDVHSGGGGLLTVVDGSRLQADHLDVLRLRVVGGGSGLLDLRSSEARLEHVALVGSSTDQESAWVSLRDAELSVRNLVSAGNAQTRGAATWFGDRGGPSWLSVENATFVEDAVDGTRGLVLDRNLDAELVNVYVGDGFGNGAIRSYCPATAGCSITLDHVVFALDEGTVYTAVLGDRSGPYVTNAVRYGIVSPGLVSTWGDPASWDLRLRADSSLVDAGRSDLTDADGTRSDVGAYGGPGGDDW